MGVFLIPRYAASSVADTVAGTNIIDVNSGMDGDGLKLSVGVDVGLAVIAGLIFGEKLGELGGEGVSVGWVLETGDAVTITVGVGVGDKSGVAVIELPGVTDGV